MPAIAGPKRDSRAKKNLDGSPEHPHPRRLLRDHEQLYVRLCRAILSAVFKMLIMPPIS